MSTTLASGSRGGTGACTVGPTRTSRRSQGASMPGGTISPLRTRTDPSDMAWIESHQEIARHPKTRKLARLLGGSVPTAIGHLHLLWWWAVDYAEDGWLGKYTA